MSLCVQSEMPGSSNINLGVCVFSHYKPSILKNFNRSPQTRTKTQPRMQGPQPDAKAKAKGTPGTLKPENCSLRPLKTSLETQTSTRHSEKHYQIEKSSCNTNPKQKQRDRQRDREREGHTAAERERERERRDEETISRRCPAACPLRASLSMPNLAHRCSLWGLGSLVLCSVLKVLCSLAIERQKST